MSPISPILPSILTLLSLTAPLASASSPSDLNFVRCTCITFSPNQNPQLCHIGNSRSLTWTAAQTFSINHPHIPIQFASEHSISTILDLQEPVDNTVLWTLNKGPTFPGVRNEEPDAVVSKMVCGIREEVRERLAGQDSGASDWLVVEVMLAFVGLVACYTVGEWVWTRWQHRGGMTRSSEEQERKKG